MKPGKTINPTTPKVRRTSSASAKTINFMREPVNNTQFEVGDPIESFCDHDKKVDANTDERVRGWIKGTVVQIDNNKLIAVQFKSNVYLTDGWMVPDHILWFPVGSDQIRVPGTGKRIPNIKKLLEED